MKQYFHYLEDGKIDKALELWTKYTEAGITEEEKKEFLTRMLNIYSEDILKKAGGIKSIEIIDVQIVDGKKAKVTSKIILNDGSNFNHYIEGSRNKTDYLINYLIKENGKWRLTGRF